MSKKLARLGDRDHEEPWSPDQRICVWCRHKIDEACQECAAEGLYRCLEPEPLSHWEFPPELPPMRELVGLPAAERLALIYLTICYEQMMRERL